jgi:hypothetical protein
MGGIRPRSERAGRRAGRDDDVKYFYKAFTSGGVVSDVAPKAFTWTGRTLMPWSPANPTGVKSGNNWLLAATRRCRLPDAGEMRDHVEVPLAEESELYDLEVLDADGNVARTVAGLTSLAYTYTEAQQQADFATPVPAPYPANRLTVRWYQVSAAVGRGFPREATHEDIPRLVDADFANVAFLTRCETSPPTDKSRNRRSITQGGGTIVPVPGFFGRGWDCDTADALSLADVDDWTLADRLFTADLWVVPQSTGAATWMAHSGLSGNRGWTFFYDNSPSELQFIYSTDGTANVIVRVAFTPVLGKPLHLAAIRDGAGDLHLAASGVILKTQNIGSASFFNSTAPLSMGGGFTNAIFAGVRLTLDVARWTADFTPPLVFPNL